MHGQDQLPLGFEDAAASMSSREARSETLSAGPLSSACSEACLPLGSGAAVDVFKTKGRRPWKCCGFVGSPSLAGERELPPGPQPAADGPARDRQDAS